MLDDKANIVRVADLARVKAEAKVKEREAEEVLSDIRARMEAERSDIERTEL